MTEFRNLPNNAGNSSGDSPVSSSNNIFISILRKSYNFLSSVKLAIVLLVVILACCIFGVTIYRGERAWALIFSTLWFNGILVLLVVNVGFCFFGRIWGRKVTLISLGMMLFHLSFVAILGGVVYNSLFYFRGAIRLTEGETLPNGELESYDSFERGRLFNLSRLKGETSLIKMRTGYKVDGVDKKAAYEISVGERGTKKQEIIYITKHLAYKGFRFFPDKEGYSVLTILYDKHGREIFGAHIPLQSLKQKGDKYLYTIGTKDGPGLIAFPQDSALPLFDLQVTYLPDPKTERAGEAVFQVWPLLQGDAKQGKKPTAEGKAAVGEKYRAGEYQLSVKEVRYWVGMSVRYDPGLPIVLASMWTGLGGMIITFFGRMRRSKKAAVSE